MAFDSINPYDSLTFVSARSPKELCEKIKEIKTPIKVVAIVQYGISHVAYIMGDVRLNEPKVKKQIKGE